MDLLWQVHVLQSRGSDVLEGMGAGITALGSARTDRTDHTAVDADTAGTTTSSVGVGLITAALAFACLTKGAFYSHHRHLLFGLVALPALFAIRPWRRPRQAAPHLAALVLAVSALASGAANGRGREGIATAALLLAASVVVEAARRLRIDERAQLADALVLLGAAIGLSGWAAVVFRWAPYALPDQGLWRAATTLTYANAGAALLVPLLLVAAARRMHVLVQLALLVSLGATQSRGGVVALAAGAVVLLAIAEDRAGIVERSSPAAAGAALALSALLPVTPLNTAPQPGFAIVGLVGGALLALATSSLPRKVLVGLAVGGTALAAVSVLTVPAVYDARAHFASQDRIDEAVAAVRVFQERPLLGAGAGIAFRYTAGDGRGPMVAQFAHNEYLQLLAEQGAVGGVAFLLGAVAVGRLIRRARPHAGAGHDPTQPAAALWAGCVAGLAAFGVHSALDFLWHIPALPLMAAALVGLALPVPGKEQR